MAISTHVLDTSIGRPAEGVRVQLERQTAADAWKRVGEGSTDADGRLRNLLTKVEAGTYRLRFDTASYHREGFFPEVIITFEVENPEQHYHVPLLLSPYGYSTYRGS